MAGLYSGSYEYTEAFSQRFSYVIDSNQRAMRIISPYKDPPRRRFLIGRFEPDVGIRDGTGGIIRTTALDACCLKSSSGTFLTGWSGATDECEAIKESALFRRPRSSEDEDRL